MLETMQRVRGVFPIASVTFAEDGSIDYEQFERLMIYLANIPGVNGVCLYGMVSEFHKLNDFEKTKLTEIFMRVLKTRKDVVSVLSVTDWSTEAAVMRAREYEKLGVDMVMLLPPFYFNPDVNEVKNHMKSVLEAVEIPVLIQYAPQATGHYIPEAELVEMAERYPNACFKIEYKPAGEFLQNYLRAKPDMVILTGYAGLEMVDVYNIGVCGVMPGASFAEVYIDIYHKFKEGDLLAAYNLYDKLEKYLLKWMITPESLLAVEKEILVRRGIIHSARCRRPACRLSPENFNEISSFLEEFKDYLVK